MYSLIIQNKNTTENFLNYYPLFMDSLDKNKIGYCKWIESGTTISTAVPELIDLTDGKEEWRAIIVMGFEDEKGINALNPFDFSNNDVKEKIENDVPIVRLAQMLGGVPGPEIRYKGEVKKEEGKIPYYYFEPDYEAQEYKELLNEQKELQEKYSFNGKLPSEVWLISPRKKVKNNSLKETQKAWKSYDETDNSDFWKRNGYPSSCRFMIYDYDDEGSAQKNADELNFWTSILILSLNYIEPSSLQAYRLYNLKTEFNLDAMEQRFEKCANRAESARVQIEKIIKNYIQGDLAKHRHSRSAVKEDVKIPPIELPQDLAGNGIDTRKFTLYPDSEMEEMSSWKTQNAEARNEIEELVKTAERRLNECAEIMRENNSVDKKEVRLLDRFEMEDSERDLSRYYDSILQLQKTLPDTTVTETKEEKEAASDISDFIRTRLSKRRVAEAALAIDVCVFILTVPSLVKYLMLGYYEKALMLIFISLCLMLVIMIPMLFVLIGNRYRLRKKISDYNDLLNKRLAQINSNEKAYTEFVNDIVIYSRGRDYLRVMKEMENAEDDRFTMLKKHLFAACSFINKIEAWSKAYHIVLSTDENMSNTYIDTTVSPIHCETYSLSDDLEYEVKLNGGEHLVSPLDFVEKLILTREELYDIAD